MSFNNHKYFLSFLAATLLIGGTITANAEAEPPVIEDTPEIVEQPFEPQNISNASYITSNGGYVLIWDKIDEASGYVIYSLGADGKYNEITRINATASGYYLGNAVSGKHSYGIKAIYTNETGEEILSEDYAVVNIYVPIGNIPQIIPINTSSTSVSFTWPTITGANGYVIYELDKTTGSWKEKTRINSGMSYYSVSDLTPGKTYTYAVKGYMKVDDGYMYSDTYKQYSFTTPLQRVQNFKVSARTNNTVSVKWSALSNVDGYIVYKYNATSKKWARISKVSSKTTSYTYTGLKPATSYIFSIRGYKYIDGKECLSESHPNITCKTAPKDVTSFSQTKTGANYATVKWGKVSGANGYIVYKYDTKNKKWVRVYVGNKTSVTIKNLNLNNGNREKLAIRAYIKDNGKEVKSVNKKTLYVSSMYKLKQQLKSLTDSYYGEWSVYVKNLDTGESISLNDKPMYAASTIKLFNMAATYERIKQGKFSESYVYNLLYTMITVSSNQSFNSLLRIDGLGYTQKWIEKNGFTSTQQYHGLNPSTNNYGLTTGSGSNMTSAKDCGKLLEQIYNGKCVSKSASAKMLSLLKQQERRWKIPAGVPSGVVVANKTGEVDDYSHDTAIVYSKGATYIICVFCHAPGQGWVSGSRRIPVVSRTVYDYFN